MQNPIILALDYSDLREAHKMISLTRDHIGMIKIGLELHTKYGTTALELGKIFNIPIFLDLKLHDIPSTTIKTIENIVCLSDKYDVKLLTVHSCVGSHAIKQIVNNVAQTNLNIAFVSMLSSFSVQDLWQIGIDASSIENHFTSIASMAFKAGARYFVCPPTLIKQARFLFGRQVKLIVPGIRLSFDLAGDQKQISTPREAISDGADQIVIGRAITKSKSPLETLLRIKKEISL